MLALSDYTVIIASVIALAAAALMLTAAKSLRARRRVITARLGLGILMSGLIGLAIGIGQSDKPAHEKIGRAHV